MPTIISVIAFLLLYNFAAAIIAYNSHNKRLKERAEGFLRIAEVSSVEPLWQLNFAALESIGNSLMETMKLRLLKYSIIIIYLYLGKKKMVSNTVRKICYLLLVVMS